MNVVKDEIMEELIISNEDFEKYFNKRRVWKIFTNKTWQLVIIYV